VGQSLSFDEVSLTPSQLLFGQLLRSHIGLKYRKPAIGARIDSLLVHIVSFLNTISLLSWVRGVVYPATQPAAA
jgi:hypothetical protein